MLSMNSRQHDPLAATVVLPRDELAVRRERKLDVRLTPAQVERLLIAAELRKRANQSE